MKIREIRKINTFRVIGVPLTLDGETYSVWARIPSPALVGRWTTFSKKETLDLRVSDFPQYESGKGWKE